MKNIKYKWRQVFFLFVLITLFSGNLRAQGVDVIFWMDNSSSISNSEWTNMENATKSLIDEVLGCNPYNRAAVVHYGSPNNASNARIFIESDFSNNATALKTFEKRRSDVGLTDYASESLQLIGNALDGVSNSGIVSTQKKLNQLSTNKLVIFLFTDARRNFSTSKLVSSTNITNPFIIYNQFKSGREATFVVLHAPTGAPSSDPNADADARAASAAIASVGGTYTGNVDANLGDPQGSGVKPRKMIASSTFDISSLDITTIAENICTSCAPVVEINAATPPSQEVCINAVPQQLIVDATGGGTLSYQWYSNTSNNNMDGTPIAGATSAAYTPPATATGTLYYYVEVGDDYCEGSTKSVPLAVSIVQNEGCITQDCVDDMEGILLWHYDDGTRNARIDQSAVVASADPSTNGAGITTAPVTVNNTRLAVSGIDALTLPQAITNNEYIEYTFTTAAWDPSTVTYVYDRTGFLDRTVGGSYHSAVAISDDNFATSSTLLSDITLGLNGTSRTFINNVRFILNPDTAYKIRVYFFNPSGGSSAEVNHDNFSMKARRYTDTPVVSDISPAAQTIDAGVAPSAITVTASPAVSYQWYSNTDNANSGGTLISGATDAAYTPPASGTQGNTYYYVVVNGYGSCTAASDPASVTIGSSLDSDGDGVPDSIDLDKDNDGILDADECNAEEKITNGIFPISGNMNTDTLTGWTIDGTYAASGAWAYPTGRIHLSSDGLQFRRDNSTVTILSQELTGVHAYYPVTITLEDLYWVKTGGGNDENTRGVLTLSYDGVIYLTIDTTFGDVPTVNTSNGASANLSTLPAITINGGASSSKVDLMLELPLGVLDGKLEFIFTAGTSEINVRDIGMKSISILACVDTDGDGVPDYLDLDSDNDGCLDAIEGGANITTDQLVNAGGIVTVGSGSSANNQNLCADDTCVDANGIPQFTIPPAGYSNTAGQSLGYSKDASNNSQCAILCTKPGASGTPLFSSVGITTKGDEPSVSNWPESVPNGYLVLDAAQKGMVITHTTEDRVQNPVEGMLIYDTTAGCVKLYRGTSPVVEPSRTGWVCIERICID